MKPFDVYPIFDIEIVRGADCKIYDTNNTEYLDFYGGHAVISIGHSEPYFVQKIKDQVEKLCFYSNSVLNKLQASFANKLGELSGYPEYSLFMVNSGAEANENALKLASFHNGRKKVLAFKNCFHGRTSAAVCVTDNRKIIAPINAGFEVDFLPLNDVKNLKQALENRDVSAVIVEGIQGVGGIQVPEPDFLETLSRLCKETETVLILDEIQSGYGRSGRFFAHQYSSIRPDIITVAKGMGNGFPVGGVLISPAFKPSYGLLGTTFGGNHLSCVAAMAVLDIIKVENLIENAESVGTYLITELRKNSKIKEVRGLGLMIGLEFDQDVKEIRRKLLFEKHIFTGASGEKIIRLLPPLCLTKAEADHFIEHLSDLLS